MSTSPNLAPLQPTTLTPLPLGSIKPTGWLRQELRIQADGQTGVLPEVWGDLGENSGWLGGAGESWERGPYYLDGLVPLGYLLDDERIIARAKKWLDWSISSQREDGLFGPAALDDWWPYYPMLKAMTQYAEASGDPRVVPFMTRFFACMREMIRERRPFSWAVYRWSDLAISILWLYNRTGDSWLVDLARELMHFGYNWSHHWLDFAHVQKSANHFSHRTHVVDNAMGIKAPGVAWEITGYKEHHDAAFRALEQLELHHGTATGAFTGDEHLAGKDPTQGTEVCAIVEMMFSLEKLISLFGEPSMGDRLESLAFNNMPGTFDGKMQVHQYDQQANQVLCTVAKRNWTNNHDDSNIFGLEPNFGCCTANYHQAWPKFASHLWMAAQDGGLSLVAYAPCMVKSSGLELEVDTHYPFEEVVRVRVVRSETNQRIPLRFRIPAWAEGATIQTPDATLQARPDSFARVTRTWKTGDQLEIRLPMRLRAERRLNDAVALFYGPLTLSLRIGEDWKKIRQGPVPDYEVHPTTPWNYALDIDPEAPEGEIIHQEIGEVVFEASASPLVVRVKARRLPEWGLVDHSAGPVPPSPVRSDEPLETVELVPYGCAKLRITEFPVLAR